jgi:hypothetical protein
MLYVIPMMQDIFQYGYSKRIIQVLITVHNGFIYENFNNTIAID